MNNLEDRLKYYKIILLLFITVFFGCNKKSDKIVDKYFFEMGTIVHFSIEEHMQNKLGNVLEFMKKLAYEISQDEYRVSQAETGKPVKVSDDFISIYNHAGSYYAFSSGIYDPTSITVAALYGFPDKDFAVPEISLLNSTKKEAGFDKLKLDNGFVTKQANTRIDLSANSKGYIIDRTASFMKELGFKNFIVNAGGDLYASGLKYNKDKFKVSIEDPDNKNGIASIILLSDKAVATSGNYERFFITKDNRRITHIFSGVTFESSNNYKSVSVIADTAEKADGLATLYFLSDNKQIQEYCAKYKTPVFIITLDNKKVKFCGWEAYEEQRL